MKKVKLSKRFGIHDEGSELEVNSTLEKHLQNGGYIAKEPAKPERKKRK